MAQENKSIIAYTINVLFSLSETCRVKGASCLFLFMISFCSRRVGEYAVVEANTNRMRNLFADPMDMLGNLSSPL